MNQASPDAPGLDALAEAALGSHADARAKALYLHYLKALALLCECAAYVDEPDYLALIDGALDEAAAHYPLRWRRAGAYRELVPREPVPHAAREERAM